MKSHDLQSIREAIDGVDESLAELLSCRAKLSRQAQAEKTQTGMPILDEAREAEIANRYECKAPGARNVAKAILRFCRYEN